MRDLSRDDAKYADSVEGHVIQKQDVEQVAIMGKGPQPFGIFQGEVVGLNTVAGKEYLVAFQPEGVGPEAQIEGQVIHTEIGTIPHDDEGSKVLILFQPVVKGRPDGWMERVLWDDGEQIRKGQFPQFGNGFGFSRALGGMGWEGLEFRGILGMGILDQHEIPNPKLVGLFEQAHDVWDDSLNSGAG